jgi:formylglycine-generating enzyme required for sulfatase activity
MNPVTKLWEFYHLRSAWNGRPGEDPGDLPIPVHRPDGSVEVNGETGIVFVLVPGGTFTMGAQGTDPSGDNFDEWATELEAPVHAVTLAPFLLGRHEVTQGQWSRLADGENPALAHAGGEAVPRTITLAHPVEYVTWHESAELLRQHGMMLPTEAQWEYACRARTDTPWAAGPRPEDLAGYGNVLDAYATEVMDNWPGAVYFRDGHAIHAPAGSFRSNDWGFFDMHGNVWEWVRDWLEFYENPVAEGDGLRVVYGEPRGQRIFRGGGYFYEARHARSARRGWDGPSFKGNVLGLRALREVIEPPAAGGR